LIPYIDLRWKLVAADTAVTVTLLQSSDIISTPATAKTAVWQNVVGGAAGTSSAFSKAITHTTPVTGNVDIIFDRDQVWYSSTNLAIRIISKTKSGFKSIPYGVVRFQIK
jgi:hypothetical protein